MDSTDIYSPNNINHGQCRLLSQQKTLARIESAQAMEAIEVQQTTASPKFKFAVEQLAFLVARSWRYKCTKDSTRSKEFAARKYSAVGINDTQQYSKIIDEYNLSIDKLFEAELLQPPAHTTFAGEADNLSKRIQKEMKSRKPVDYENLASKENKCLASLSRMNSNTSSSPNVRSLSDCDINSKRFTLMDPTQVKLVDELPDPSEMNQYAKYFREALKDYRSDALKQALSKFKICVRLSQITKNQVALLLNCALANYRMGSTTEAINYINRAITLAPSDKRLYYFRSIIHRQNGEYLKASSDSVISKGKRIIKSKKRREVAKSELLMAQRNKLLEATQSNTFYTAVRTPPKNRTSGQKLALIQASQSIPFLANYAEVILSSLWDGFTFGSASVNDTVACRDSKCSLFLVLSGSFDVITVVNGSDILQKILEPNSIFSRNCTASNQWDQTRLVARGSAEYLALDDVTYKYTLKNSLTEMSEKSAAYLTSLRIFEDWTPEQMQSLGVLSETLDYPAGSTLAVEGAPVPKLCFIMSGIAAAHRNVGNEKVQIGSLTSGDVYGENAVFDPINSTHSFSLVTQTRTRVLQIDKKLINRRHAFDFMRLGNLSTTVLNNIKEHCLRIPSDKNLLHMIHSKCQWENQRRCILRQVLADKAKAKGNYDPQEFARKRIY